MTKLRASLVMTCLIGAIVVQVPNLPPVRAAQTQGQDEQTEVRILRTRLRNKRAEANAKRQAKPQPQPTAERPDLVLQTGHAQRIDALAFAPGGRYFASGSPDSTIKIWDALGGRELRAFAAGVAVRCVAFSPDGETLAGGGGDGQLRLWEVATGKLIGTLPGHAKRIESLTFSRDGRWMATAGSDAVVIVWDFAARKILHRLGGFKDWAQAVAFSNDGRWLAAGGRDRAVKLWDSASGEENTVFVQSVNAAGNQDGPIKSLAFAPDNAALVVGSQSGSLKVWRLARGELLATPRALGGAVIALAFSAEGHTLTVAAQDRTIKQFDAGAYREQFSDVLRGDPEQYDAAAFSADGQWLVSCNGGLSLELRRVAGSELRPLTSTANAALAVAFSPDGLWLATGNKDATATLWDLVAGRAVARLPVISGDACAVAFDANSELLAAGTRGGYIKIWDVTGAEKGAWKAHRESINALVFTADGRLISASADRTIKIWNASGGEPLATLAEHSADVNSLSLSPDGGQLAS
ncbi:MAG: WD40 repeat domain-containing protein, partial [Acidobacteriota bacterium]